MLPKHPLLQKCLAQLEALPHLKVESDVEEVPYVGKTAIADGRITLHSPQGSATYVVEIKTNVAISNLGETTAYLETLKQRLPNHYRPLLIAEKLSNLTIKGLIQHNFEFIDAAGNCYLNSPALYILTSNTSLNAEKPAKSLDITTSTLQLMYVLLQVEFTKISPPLFSELAEAAGISLKTLESSLDRLCQLKYLQRQPKGGYRIAKYTKLLERWELGYTEALRSKLLLGTYTPTSGRSFAELEDDLIYRAKDERYLIGGELAGAIATKYLRPIGATLHLPESQNPTTLSLKLKLKPDKQGTITLMRQFGSRNAWDNAPMPMLADPLLIHAEMMTLATDERVRETSDRLFKQYLLERQHRVETG